MAGLLTRDTRTHGAQNLVFTLRALTPECNRFIGFDLKTEQTGIHTRGQATIHRNGGVGAGFRLATSPRRSACKLKRPRQRKPGRVARASNVSVPMLIAPRARFAPVSNSQKGKGTARLEGSHPPRNTLRVLSPAG